MKRLTADVVVVGAGATGCASAYELSRRGLSVMLLARNGVAADASGKAWGGLTAHFGVGVPGMMLERYRRATQMHVALYDELQPQLPANLDWQLRPVSSLKLATEESELAELREDARWKSTNGFKAEIIDGDSARKIEPTIVDEAIGGMLTNTEWEVDCVRYANALVQVAVRRGCQIVETAAIRVDVSGSGGVIVSTSDAGEVSAQSVVLATGPWSNEIAGVPALPIHAVKGEILRVRHPGNNLQTRVGYGGMNVGRKPDGLVWLGTYERDLGLDDSITYEGRELILSGVARYLPSVATAEVAMQTACLRPASSDGLPIIGEVAAGIYGANGAGKKGILMSPYFAELISDAILDGVQPPPEFSPHRF